MVICIYCHKSEPAIRPADAHIFPDAMGGVTFSKTTVCHACNGKTAKQFEEIEIRNFAFFRSILGIANRRRQVPTVDAIVKFNDEEFKVSLDQTGEPNRAIVSSRSAHDNKKTYSVFGPSAKAEAKREEIDMKHPSFQWKEMDLSAVSPPEAIVECPPDLTRLSLRRLAAKIAFERWAYIRGSELARDTEYDAIRNFVLTGEEIDVRCGVLTDRQLIDRVFGFPIGNHAVAIFGHPHTTILGAFVTFFGLFHFWIVLSRQYRALAAFDDLLFEDPQNRVARTPVFRSGVGHLLINWAFIEKTYQDNPDEAVRVATAHAVRKLKGAVDAFYDGTSEGAEFKRA
jgi:hypothetical protein